MKKKILLVGAMLGLIITPVVSIAATNVSTLKKIPKIGQWYQASKSKISNGRNGTILEASNGDLYALGASTKLQVKRRSSNSFIDAPEFSIIIKHLETIFEASNGDLYVMGTSIGLHVLKRGTTNLKIAPGTKITDGYHGTIFETSNGDLYAMGNGSGLEVLKKGATNFKLALGSNIKNGLFGRIFETSNGDLYAMGSGSGLEVLKREESEFKPTLGSNINNGARGTIFEASNGDLYAMGLGTKLQVLKREATTFKHVASSSINGPDGIIFETSNGDLYAMGYGSKLQVKRESSDSFIDAPGSIISDGKNGVIFEVSNGDLYAMGSGSGLEVLKKGTTNFQLAPGSNIKNGLFGRVFEASNGDLYAMGFGSSLEVLKREESEFKSALGSNIKDGTRGTIFETSNGDLYAMANGSKLQVLKNNRLEFEWNDETTKNKNDGSIKIKNFASEYSKLQYKLNSLSIWIDVPSNGEIKNLFTGTYDFRWIGKQGEQYVGGTDTSISLNRKIIIRTRIPYPRPTRVPWLTITGITSKYRNDGTITVSNFKDIGLYSKVQYKLSSAKTWIDVPDNGKIINLIPGKYEFQWVGKNNEQYIDDPIRDIGIEYSDLPIVKDNAKILPPLQRPNFASSDEIAKGASDGAITVTNFKNPYSKMQYNHIENLGAWIDVPDNGQIINLAPGTYLFRWIGKNAEHYVGGTDHIQLDDQVQTIMKGKKIHQPTLEPNFASGNEIAKGANNGAITVTSFDNPYSKVQYKLSSAPAWIDVPPNGKIHSLVPGTYNFQWVGKNDEQYAGGTSTSIPLSDQTINDGLKIYPPLQPPNFVSNDETAKGASDGTIIVTIPDGPYSKYSKVQYKLSSALAWAEMPHDGQIQRLVPDTYNFRWVGKKNEQYIGQTGMFIQLNDQIIKNNPKIAQPIAPNFINSDETIKGTNDGSITVTNFDDPYSKVQYKLSSAPTWTEMPHDGQIQRLAPGTYNFQWVGENNEQYAGGTSTSIPLSDQIISDGLKIPQPILTPNFASTHTTVKGAEDGTITVTNFDDPYSKVQYKLSSAPTWANIPLGGQIQRLAPGTYSFRWVGENNEEYAGGDNTSIPLSDQTIKNNPKIAPPLSAPNFASTHTTFKGAEDGTITVTNFDNRYSKVQYKLSSAPEWTNMPVNGKITKLAPGTYDFQWVGKSNEQYAGGLGTSIAINYKIVIETKITPPLLAPSFAIKNETIKGTNDGAIIVTSFDNPYSKVQYKLSSAPEWTNMPVNGKITKLTPGTYNFRWVGNNDEQYAGGTSTSLPLSDQSINDGLKIPLALAPNFASTHTTVKGANDGTITVTNFDNPYSKVQYKLNSAPEWTNMPVNGKITKLTPGTYSFQWVGNNDEQYAGGTSTSLPLSDQTINDGLKIPLASAPDFASTHTTVKGVEDGTITVTNFDNPYSKVQYKLSSAPSWTNVPLGGQIQHLAPGTYSFRWVGNNDEQYAGGDDTSLPLSDQTINDGLKIPLASTPNFASTHTTVKGVEDGTITVTNFDNPYSKVQYKLSSAPSWTNVPLGGQIQHLAPGTYSFRWVSKNNEQYVGGDSTSLPLNDQTISDGLKIPLALAPNFAIKNETIKGTNDGGITVTNFDDPYSKVQYKLSSAPSWTNVPLGGQITMLTPGTYNFRWVGENNEQYAGGDDTSLPLSDQTISDGLKIPLASTPNFASTHTTVKGVEDGTITVTNFDNPYSKVQYKLSSAPSWTNVPLGGQIQHLAPGTYSFQWVGNNNEQYAGGDDTSLPLNDQTISDGLKIPLASTPNFASTHTTVKGVEDGTITVTNFDNPYSKVQYKLSSAPAWTNVPLGGQIQHLAPGTYSFQWVGNNNEQYAGGDSTSLPLNDQTISDGLKIPLASAPNFAIKNETIKGTNDGTITVTNFDNSYSKVQYKLSSAPAWTNMPLGGEIQKLTPGTYNFRWVGENNEQYAGGDDTSLPLNDQTISDGLKIPLASAPNFASSNETIEGAEDGTITATNLNNPYSKVQYKLSSASAWTNMPLGGEIQKLAPGTYNFQWVGKNNEAYPDGKLAINLQNQIIEKFKKPKTSNKNLKTILAIAISTSLISLIIVTLLIKHFISKNQKIKTKK